MSIGYIGVGSQGVRVLTDFLRQSEVQIVSVCDVNTGSDDFKEWGKGEMLRRVREVLGDNSWGRFANGGLGGLYEKEFWRRVDVKGAGNVPKS